MIGDICDAGPADILGECEEFVSCAVQFDFVIGVTIADDPHGLREVGGGDDFRLALIVREWARFRDVTDAARIPNELVCEDAIRFDSEAMHDGRDEFLEAAGNNPDAVAVGEEPGFVTVDGFADTVM